MAYGKQFKSRDDYLRRGLRGQRVKLASFMAMDGISKFATFYSDFDAIAAQAADAKREMRELDPTRIVSTGLLHVFVEIHARGILPTSKLNRRYFGGRAHLVLTLGDRIIQVDKQMLLANDQSTKSVVVESLIVGYPSLKNTLEFAFDLAPPDYESPVEVILIDGDGHQHKARALLSNVIPKNTP